MQKIVVISFIFYSSFCSGVHINDQSKDPIIMTEVQMDDFTNNEQKEQVALQPRSECIKKCLIHCGVPTTILSAVLAIVIFICAK